jgi:AcrR family transcriptional regulator
MADMDVLSPEKEQQILRGAATIFGQDGYEGASMSRIAACAGVSKGTLYNYFEGKAELFQAWIGRECEAKLSRVFDIEDPDGDPAVTLQAIGQRMIQMMMSDSGLTMYRLTVSEAGKFPELARAFYELGPARATQYMAAWLRRKADARQLAIKDPVFAAEQFFALCQSGIGIKRRLGLLDGITDGDLRRIVDEAVRMFLNTYGVDA